MASNHHYPCHCQPTQPTPPTTACYCTICCTTAHYSAPPPPPAAPPLDPLVHSISSHLHHHQCPPPHTQIYAPPHNNHILQSQHYDQYPPSQTHQNHHLFQNNRQQEGAQQKPPPVNTTVSSLIRRIAALESSLRRRNRSPGSSSLRDAAARTIQTHFRAFLVRRSKTLRHLKDLAYIKSALTHLKSSVSGKTHFDPQPLYRESMNLLIKLDSIKGTDPMIRDGKRSISRELIRFMEFIDEMSTESHVISVKNVRFGKNCTKSMVLKCEHKTRASDSMVLGEDARKLPENLKSQVKKYTGCSSAPKEEEEEESLELENPRTHGVPQIRTGGLWKSQGVGKSQPKVTKNVSFAVNGNDYRVITGNDSPVSSDDGDSSNGNEAVEEIGVSSKETEVEEDSSEISDNEMNPRRNLTTKIDQATKKNHPEQEADEDDDDDGDGDDNDSFVFSAPLPAKMEYRVDSVKKQQTAKQ